MIKTWLIKVSAPIYGADIYYRAYSKNNPELLDNWYESICENIIRESWDKYSWQLHLEDGESEEDYEEACNQAWENWRCDCCIEVSEATQEDLQNIAPDGNVDNVKIIYDERDVFLLYFKGLVINWRSIQKKPVSGTLLLIKKDLEEGFIEMLENYFSNKNEFRWNGVTIKLI